jgi:hypothetical protein
MAYNVDVYKGVTKLGSGSATNGLFTITSFTATASRVTGPGRNVQVTATSGNNVGATQQMRCITDGGATLTMNHSHKYT